MYIEGSGRRADAGNFPRWATLSTVNTFLSFGWLHSIRLFHKYELKTIFYSPTFEYQKYDKHYVSSLQTEQYRGFIQTSYQDLIQSFCVINRLLECRLSCQLHAKHAHKVVRKSRAASDGPESIEAPSSTTRIASSEAYRSAAVKIFQQGIRCSQLNSLQ